MAFMERLAEPELMDAPEQVEAYVQADFSLAHNQLIDAFVAKFPSYRPEQILDLGCGAADVTLRFARLFAQADLLGLDAGKNMLLQAKSAISAEGYENRMSLVQAHLPRCVLRAHQFDAVVSNSLLHHLNDPMDLWSAISHSAASGAVVAVMDLMRPDSEDDLNGLLRRYVADAPPILKEDFEHSLRAAYRIEEVVAQLSLAGLDLSVEAISDRHLLIIGRVDAC